VLAWPVFENQDFGQRLNLRSLLQSSKTTVETPRLSVSADFDLNEAPQLLSQYLDNVHIFNPILEEVKVREYMMEARFNGLGWDARSCLLVNDLYLTSSSLETDCS
jgi:hypothetical protein